MDIVFKIINNAIKINNCVAQAVQATIGPLFCSLSPENFPYILLILNLALTVAFMFLMFFVILINN